MQQIDEQLVELLKQARQQGASDVHISVASPPVMRLHNTLVVMEGASRLMPPDTQRLLFSVLDEEHKRSLMEEGEVDLAFGLPDVGRFRINIYRQRGSYAAAIRLMNSHVPEAEKLGLPQTVIDL